MPKSKREQYRKAKERAGGCEACGFKVIDALHIHHYTPKRLRPKKRVSRDKEGTTFIVLCANCHNILHHQIGWNECFAKTIGRGETISIIHEQLVKHNLPVVHTESLYCLDITPLPQPNKPYLTCTEELISLHVKG